MMYKKTRRARPLARTLAVLSLLLVLAASATARAGLVSVTGNGKILDPASQVTAATANFIFPSDPVNDPPINAWDEKQGVVLTQNVYVDINAKNSSHTIDSMSQLSSTFQDPDYVIKAGTVVDSSLLYYSPQGDQKVKDVTFTFSSQILGVIVDSDRFFTKSDPVNSDYFRATDFLGNPDTVYPTSHFNNRGLELGSPDSILVNIVGNTVELTILGASNPGDQVRVITAAPEPTTLVMALTGLVSAAIAARRRRIAKVS